MTVRPYVVLQRFQSSSRPLAPPYEVRRDRSLHVYCTCPGWVYSKAVPKTCTHLKRMYASGALPRPVVSEAPPAVAERPLAVRVDEAAARRQRRRERELARRTVVAAAPEPPPDRPVRVRRAMNLRGEKA